MEMPTLLFSIDKLGSVNWKNFTPKLLYEDQVVTGQEEKQDDMFNYFDGPPWTYPSSMSRL